MALMKKDRQIQNNVKLKFVSVLIKFLQQYGYHPQDIIFDPNIFAIATGIEEHNNMELILLKPPVK